MTVEIPGNRLVGLRWLVILLQLLPTSGIGRLLDDFSTFIDSSLSAVLRMSPGSHESTE